MFFVTILISFILGKYFISDNSFFNSSLLMELLNFKQRKDLLISNLEDLPLIV
jgi:hypothetical protein